MLFVTAGFLGVRIGIEPAVVVGFQIFEYCAGTVGIGRVTGKQNFAFNPSAVPDRSAVDRGLFVAVHIHLDIRVGFRITVVIIVELEV